MSKKYNTSPIHQAVDVLQNGGLVAFPTETVYGLGADARNPLAIRRIFSAKGRPTNHPVIIHLHSAADPERWAHVPPTARILMRRFSPGPLTLVLKRQPCVIDEITGGLDTVALRVPQHPLAQRLLAAFGHPIAAPSANRFGRISSTTAQHVRDELGDRCLVLDGGPCTVGIESTIVDLSGASPTLLRPGAVPETEIVALIGPLGRGTTPAPGTLPHHYAPRTALRISDDPEAEAAVMEAAGQSVAILLAGPPEDHARRLYAELRRLDAAGVDVLVAQRSPHGGLGFAINDRLQRAAHD